MPAGGAGDPGKRVDIDSRKYEAPRPVGGRASVAAAMAGRQTWRAQRMGIRFMSRLSQETIAIIGVGVTFLGMGVAAIALGLSVANDLRAEMRADRAEARADREAIRVEAREDRKAIRAEARADREQFERQILRLIRRQGILFGSIEGWPQDRRETGDTPNGAPPAE